MPETYYIYEIDQAFAAIHKKLILKPKYKFSDTFYCLHSDLLDCVADLHHSMLNIEKYTPQKGVKLLNITHAFSAAIDTLINPKATHDEKSQAIKTFDRIAYQQRFGMTSIQCKDKLIQCAKIASNVLIGISVLTGFAALTILLVALSGGTAMLPAPYFAFDFFCDMGLTSIFTMAGHIGANITKTAINDSKTNVEHAIKHAHSTLQHFKNNDHTTLFSNSMREGKSHKQNSKTNDDQYSAFSLRRIKSQ